MWLLKPFGLAQRYSGLLDLDVNLALGGKTQPPTGSSTIRYRDARAGNDVRLVVTQHAQQTGLEGTGEFHGEPFRLSGSVGPEAFPVDLVVQMLETKAILHGSIREPVQLKGFKLALDIAGPTPQRLDPVVGFHLPDLPLYHLRGDLVQRGKIWQFTNVNGSIGDTDLSGRIKVNVAGKNRWSAPTSIPSCSISMIWPD